MSFEKYKKDIDQLIEQGHLLQLAMIAADHPDKAKELKITNEQKTKLPHFHSEYQAWYSEANACIAQLMPNRLDDFIEYYNPKRTRKEITYGNYSISDYLRGLTITRGYYKEKVVGPDAAISSFAQQLGIVISLKQRFESSLFDIRTLVQADLYKDELDASEDLNKKGFARAAGAIAGVVLESHLRSVCNQHKVTVTKNATLGKINDLLKKENIVEVPVWRFIQHLIDIRNLCDHKLEKDPAVDQLTDLISGVRKIIKTVF